MVLKIGDGTSMEVPEDEILRKNVQSITIYCESPSTLKSSIRLLYKSNSTASSVSVTFDSALDLRIQIFQLHNDEGVEEIENGDTAAYQQWVLPSKEFHGLWDTLIYDGHIKQNLLDYISSTMLFSDRKVNPKIVAWNRVVLLHGPPGTGKTSLCKGLAQKLSIRLSDRYAFGQLVEINSHSLFSKWFSESGKLVMKMFAHIREMVEDDSAFVCVLIDEVESLTAARKAALGGSEPSDALRVVNAVLTQLDALRSFPNVLILTTSNITGAIDLAFVDRADIKQFIGLPSPAACYVILSSAIQELMRVGIITPRQSLLEVQSLELLEGTQTEATQCSFELYHISRRCHGLSGRALRKLPFLAHAFFLGGEATLEQFLASLNRTIDRELEGRKELEQ